MTLLRGLGVALAISLAAGLLLAFATGRSNLAVQAFAMSGVFASPFFGFIMGQHRRVHGKGRGRLALAVLILGAGIIAFFWGLASPPVIGHSENQILFPGLLLIGVLGGLLSRGR